MKAGDLVRFKKGAAEFLSGPGDPQELYPFKFEVGIVTSIEYPEAVFICFPSSEQSLVLCSYLEIVQVVINPTINLN